MIATQSDHYPIMLNIVANHDYCHRPFQFYIAWFKDLTCKTLIKEAWQTYYKGFPIFQLVQKIRDDLKMWNRTHFGYTHQRIQAVTAQLEVLCT